jgi:hypothetical protein
LRSLSRIPCLSRAPGSCANGLSLCNNNDLDVSIELPEAIDDKELTVEAVQKMGELMEAVGMKNVKIITQARVPIVKFEHPDSATKCDITVNNELAVMLPAQPKPKLRPAFRTDVSSSSSSSFSPRETSVSALYPDLPFFSPID